MLDYYDFARFNPITITGVKCSTTGYTLEFWVYVYNYIPSNISAFDLKWHKQLRISFTYTTPNIQVTCYPAYDSTVPTSYLTTKGTFNLPNYTWTYFRCSPDRTAGTYTFLSNSATLGSQPFTSFPIAASVPATSNLVIADSSTNSWGAIFFRQIRLWGCSSCISPTAYLK